MRCSKCRLHTTCRSVKIDGRGSDFPRVMFVGQAPGIQEDETATCFVGPAGQLLTQAIKEYGLKPAYLSNLVKCFPPDDRDPKPDEIEACKPYLMEEIEKKKPEVIVALGNISLKALTGKVGVTAYSGQIVGEIGTSKVFSLFHPSFILRYPRNLSKFEMHVRALKDLLHGEPEAEDVKVSILPPAKAYAKCVGAVDLLTFDFETTGQFKQYGGKLRSIGINVDGKENFIVNAEHAEFDKFMRLFLAMPQPKCAYNSAFEQRWCLDQYGRLARNLTVDPLLMHYLVDENSAHDLESVASQHLQARSWDISHEMQVNGWTYETVPFDKLAYYNGLDVYYTHNLVGPLNHLVHEEGLQEVYGKILMPLSRLCAKLEHRGMYIDKEWANRIDKEYGASNTKNCDAMIEMLGLPDDFNPNSSMQISKILRKLGLKTDQQTESGKMSVKESALKPLKEKHKFVPIYLDWKEKQTLCNNFLQKFPRFVDKEGLLHPNFNPSFVVTGRMSVTNPPAQAIPVDKNVRGMFASRFKDGKILAMDFQNLEMRILASEAKDERMIEVFNQGGDLHDDTSTRMFGKGFDKAQRNIAKRINFGTVYGISDFALSREFNVPTQVAAKWLDDHRKTYPGVYKWMRVQHEFVKREGWIKSRTGRIRHFPEAKSGNLPKWELERILRQVGNFPIQNLGADITNLTAIHVNRELEAKFKSVLFHQVHDSILLDVHPDEDAESLQSLCTKVIADYCQSFCSVPLTVSFEVGERWS